MRQAQKLKPAAFSNQFCGGFIRRVNRKVLANPKACSDSEIINFSCFS